MPELVTFMPGMDITPDGAIRFFGMGTRPENLDAATGAVMRDTTTCTECHQRFGVGDVCTAELAPNMAGTWHHTDCADPQLEARDA